MDEPHERLISRAVQVLANGASPHNITMCDSMNQDSSNRIRESSAIVQESISHIIGESLKSLPINPEDLIRLGMGIGASLGAQGILNAPQTTNMQERIEDTMQQSAETRNRDSALSSNENGPLHKNLPILEDRILNRGERDSSKSRPPRLKETKRESLPTCDAANTEKNLTQGKFMDGHNYVHLVDPTSVLHGLLDTIAETRVGARHVEYLPFAFNVPDLRNIDPRKPRSSGEEWKETGYDPWSDGKESTSRQLIRSLSQEMKKWPARDDKVVEPAVSNTARDFAALCSFVRHGKYRELEDMINNPDWTLPIDYCGDAGNTLLMIACQNGNRRIAKLCLRRGSEINKKNLNGNSCLHFAFGYGFGTY